MSHKATNWAVTVRGIPAPAKLVLWHLADRHNKDTGRCDPSQKQLSIDCELSRSSLNNHLKTLEEAGLIERTKRLDSDTKRQKTTFYILRFDRECPQDMPARVQDVDTEAVSKLEADPCPNSGQSRVQILDTNPVREPGREPCAAESAANKAFEVFFDVHPRPVKRDATLAAFREALEVGVSADWILSSAKRYASEQDGNAARFIAMSDQWLLGSRWADYPFKAEENPETKREVLTRLLRSTVPSVRQEAKAKWGRLFPDEGIPMEATE